MREILRTNDPVLISYAQSLLKDVGIDSVVFDGHTSILEGSIGAIPRRIMVIDEDADRARSILSDSDLDV
ncbi:DUF2007 domain-containing protein [Iodidimonas sp. SYSU 1G8]|uniref:putative signal transducing protein n=1 Tax=Iodidimonas sp. SYSU 1G8 TaxID=3133967 RepID=UPI0031FE773A